MSKRRGPPTKLTPQVHDEIVNIIRKGNFMDTAASYVGISRQTLHDWMRRGRRERERVAKDGRFRVQKEEEIYVNLSIDIEKAQAEAEADDVANITNASKEDWKASAWRLDRRFNKRWGNRFEQKIEHSGNVNITTRAKEIDEYYREKGVDIDDDQD